LVRIVPPRGVEVDDKLRPYIIIDPRAGHGPGIGGFKEDSEVGVALQAGHPVYFVIFYPDPEPGQTLADVTDAEAEFVRIVAERHPQSSKPVLVGNCQGGWAVMMLAAARPDIAGRWSSTARRCRTGRATTATTRCATRGDWSAVRGYRCSRAISAAASSTARISCRTSRAST